MLKSIEKIFYPPIFEDHEKTQNALYLNATLWILTFLFTIVLISQFIGNLVIDTAKIAIFFIIITTLVLQFLLKIGYVKITSIFLLIIGWIILIILATSSAGLHDTAFIGTILIVLLSGLLLNFKYSLIFAILSAFVAWVLAYLEINNIIHPDIDGLYNVARDFTVIFVLIGFISYLTIQSLQKSLERSRIDSIKLSEINRELQILHNELEQRVELRTSESELRAAELVERTAQLELANLHTKKRAMQLQAISEVTRVIAQVRELNDLLPRIVKVISEKFDFYHTGIYLTDEANQYAILSAASSEGGKQMLSKRYQLKVGSEGIVSYVIETGIAKVASANDETKLRYANSADLPNTQSEMAVPLLSGNKTIGVLDIQSEKPNAFTEEYVDVIQTLADQVSIAIENARLFDSTQKSISEAETIYRQYIRSEWANLATTENILGFRYTVTGASALENLIEASEIKKVTLTGQIVTDTDIQSGQAILGVPIKLRDEVIGVIDIRTSGKQNWTQDEIGLVQAVAERVAVSAENARLFDQSTSRAERESAVSEITSKIRSTNNPNEMIEIAINELKQILNLKEIHIVPYTPPLEGTEWRND